MSPQPSEKEHRDLAHHVEICGIRYGGIHERLRRIEYVLFGLLGLLVFNGEGPLTNLLIRLLFGH